MVSNAQAAVRRASRRPLRVGASVLALTAALAGTAAAQAAGPQAPGSQEAAVDEVVVTASRAASTGFTAPSPTSIVSSETLERQGATNIAQVLNQLPAFKATISAAANGVRTQQPGASLADLRGLGPQRTLILVNGMRVVPMAPVNTQGAFVAADLNTIPSLLVERAEVVTGGASAQWGSDAVSGVVNILLKNDFTGLEARVQGGESRLGDFKELRLGALGGIELAGGRVHIVAGVDYVTNDGLPNMYSRDWSSREVQIIANAAFATNGLPAQILSPDVHTSISPGGLILGPANFTLRNQEFRPGGQTLSPFQFGFLPNATSMIGGQGRAVAAGARMSPAVRRANPYLRAEFELSDTLEAFVEASYSWTKGASLSQTTRDTAITVRRDNPFLPAQVVNAMTAANLQTFTLGRINGDIHRARPVVENKTPHIAAGFQGEIGRWDWDAHIAYGRNIYDSAVSSNRIRANFNFAVDAVTDPATGRIVCRATLPGAGFNAAAAGCVPINLFGEGSPSAPAIAYVTGTSTAHSTYEQTSAAANIRGEPFSTWAGPVAVAAGVEFREESQYATGDPLSLASGFEVANSTAFSGAYSVREAYVDSIVPLLSDHQLAKSLSVSGAFRVADYSNAGTQETWKVGATYEPFDGLRLRTTRSRDIRAPALFELYSPGASAGNAISVRGFSVNIPVNTAVGNPNLKPEVGDTFTIGAVVEPKGVFSGLRASVDYYDIELKGAITSLPAASIAGFCNLGQQVYCNMFTFGATGAPTSLAAPIANAAAFQSIGYDFAVSYRKPLRSLVGAGAGDVGLALNGTYTAHSWVDLGTGAGRIDRAGENSQINNGAVPRWRTNLNLTYDVGRASMTAQVNFISKGKIDNTYNSTPATTINVNRVPAMAYLNLYATWDVGRRLQLFGAVNNVFDTDPPSVPSTTLFTATNPIYYDVVGQAFQLGVTFRY